MNVLIVGGSSGIGLELAILFRDQGDTVLVTGRTFAKVGPMQLGFHYLEIGADSKSLARELNRLVERFPKVDLLIYAAGFYQEGMIGEFYNEHIFAMINVGLTAPALILRRLLRSADTELKGFISITSTSATDSGFWRDKAKDKAGFLTSQWVL